MKRLKILAFVVIASFSLQSHAALIELGDAGNYKPRHIKSKLSNFVPGYFAVSKVGAGSLDFGFHSNTVNHGLGHGKKRGFEYFKSFAKIFDFTYKKMYYDATVAFDNRGAGSNSHTGVSATAVPEPSIVGLFAAGLLGLGFARRRKETI